MRKGKVLSIMIVLAITLLAGTFTGCSNKSEQQGTTAPENKTSTVTAAGSSALQPLAEKAAQQFKSKNPNVNITVQGGGSGTGLTQVAGGAVDIGNSDIFAQDKKGIDAAKLSDHKVCVVGFAVVANNKVKIDNLTKDQLIGIFTGKITNWKDVGGDDLKILVVNRPKSSGTRATFKKYGLDGKDEVEGMALTEDSSGAVKKTIESNDGAIGYLALSYLTGSDITGIKTLKLNGLEPVKDNIVTGKYPIWSYEHMYTNGEAKGAVKEFIDYVLSNETRTIMEKLGYIPMADMKVQR